MSIVYFTSFAVDHHRNPVLYTHPIIAYSDDFTAIILQQLHMHIFMHRIIAMLHNVQ